MLKEFYQQYQWRCKKKFQTAPTSCWYSEVQCSGDLKSDHLKSWNIWNTDFFRSDFKWSSFGNSYSPNHSKIKPFKIWKFLSGFQIVSYKMMAICPDFKNWHWITRTQQVNDVTWSLCNRFPYENWTIWKPSKMFGFQMNLVFGHSDFTSCSRQFSWQVCSNSATFHKFCSNKLVYATLLFVFCWILVQASYETFLIHFL